MGLNTVGGETLRFWLELNGNKTFYTDNQLINIIHQIDHYDLGKHHEKMKKEREHNKNNNK